jgi:HPt (histidine-containing phosphotransfer) domain-containing protein
MIQDITLMDFKYIKTDYLDMVTEGDKDLLKELVDMFREQVAEFNSDMKNLFDERNYKALGDLAHKAKSSVAIMGMDDLAEMLKKFELDARDGKDPEHYESYLLRFEKDTRFAMAELESLVNNK